MRKKLKRILHYKLRLRLRLVLLYGPLVLVGITWFVSFSPGMLAFYDAPSHRWSLYRGYIYLTEGFSQSPQPPLGFDFGIYWDDKPYYNKYRYSLVYPTALALLVALSPLYAVWRRRGRARHGLCIHCGELLTGTTDGECSRCGKPCPPGLCPRCGYSLRGNVSGICPECGRSIGPDW